jgi:hypothetical protein
MTPTRCPMCGHPAARYSGRGRPPVYCLKCEPVARAENRRMAWARYDARHPERNPTRHPFMLVWVESTKENDGSIYEGVRAYSRDTVERIEHERASLGAAQRAEAALICPTCESDKLVPMPDGSVRCRWNECASRFDSLEAAATLRQEATDEAL